MIHILSQELEEKLPSILKSVVQENGIKNFFNPLQPGVAFSGGIDKQNRAVLGESVTSKIFHDPSGGDIKLP